MNTRPEIPARTREQQELVSNPDISAWVSANAGAGKTTVLARRVIRLLLAGTPPARVLCLTFTKAAAANMANKVLQTLREWVRLDDEGLDAALRGVTPLKPSPALRALARRLFAAAIETPGGLKVQTIHAFCDRVLHQFPFEAGVQAGFDVLDEVREADLIARARQSVLIEAANVPDGVLGRALTQAVAVATDRVLEEALSEAVRERRHVRRLIDGGGDVAVAAALDLKPSETADAIEREIFQGPNLPRGEWKSVAATIRSLGGNAASCGARLAAAAGAADDASALSLYLSAFFTGANEPRDDGGFGSAAARRAQPELFASLFAERERLLTLCDRLLSARARTRTGALLDLADAVIHRFEEQKRSRGALDYADLIDKTVAMFEAYESSWVLYKLDGGIDHVLIDEAQDTSPEQWRVIERLTEDFFAGKSAHENRIRTIFAVGDEKQSIFSFQGADPREFDRMSRAFSDRVTATGARFEHEKLDLSFRSAPKVLNAIDAVFSTRNAFKGLAGADEKTVHQAIRATAPSLVEVWPIEKAEAEDEGTIGWDAPLDALSESSAVVRLAQKIATAVKSWVDGGLVVGDGARRRTPSAGDVIVLVRQRGALFEAILQALKRAGVPVAGADRLKLIEHIAVMDLIALGDALTLEADDLALACALKSPLVGLDENDLFALAHGRKASLAASLAEKARSDTRIGEAAAKLARWSKEAGELRPFDFYSRVLGRDGGRERMLHRLGIEAADALDEFLAHALVYEQSETPSLTGFLAFLRRAGAEVKRDLEVESDVVRVMTVHGAKGLEAPILVLTDTMSMPDGRYDPKLLPLPGTDAFVWALGKTTDSTVLRSARLAAREAREAEYRRLLYVALTRAADALIVCGHESARQGNSGPSAGCWYQLVHDALKDELVEGLAPGFPGDVWRWRPENIGHAPSLAPEKRTIKVPAWVGQRISMLPPALVRTAPSKLEAKYERLPASERQASGAFDPVRRGDLMHRLLQRLPDLPVGERRAAATRLLGVIASDLAPADRDALADEAFRVVEHPELAVLFGPESRAEIEIIARSDEGEIVGRIDRIAVTQDTVVIADFKTGVPPIDAAAARPGYIRQLALYSDVLARVYPGKAMRGLLVWTAGPAIHKVEEAMLKSVLVKTGQANTGA